ncbi:MAG: DUF3604 domain-containing protein [Haloferacaceae archaeon]
MTTDTGDSPYGRAALEPGDDVVAGGYTAWTITYTAGELGLDDGGAVLVAFSQTSDVGDPQFDSPAAENYCRVETAADARVDAEYDPRGHTRPMKHAVRITVRDGSVGPGETVTLRLGDRRDGSLGLQAQSFPERGFAFRVLVDAHNTGEFVALPDDLTVDVVPGAATDLAAVVPSTAAVGDEVELSVRAEDYWGNVATGFDGDVRVDAPPDLDAPDRVELAGGTGTATVTPTATGVWRVRVRDDGGDLAARSNPLVCEEAVDAHTFWGDIHGQSGETVGTGTVREYYRHLVDAAFLDFGAHAGNDFQITDEVWEEITAAVRAFHDPGEFVAFHCYEWSANTSLGGDHNVYFRGDDPELNRSSNWLVADADDRHAGTHPVAELYDLYDGRDDVLVVPHQGGRPATLDVLDPDLTPFVEIVSVWGVFEWFAREAYDRGYPVGVVGGSDDHCGRPGTAPPDNLDKHNVEGGLMAARADELTREGLWDAFTDRRVYATTGARILLDVAVDAGGGTTMGGSTSVPAEPELTVSVHGTAPVAAVDLFRGSERVASRDLTDGDDAVELRWRGARSRARDKLIDWSGGVALDRGEIGDVEPFGFDHPEDGVTTRRADAVFWDAGTTGNHQGVRLRVDAPTDATLSVGTAAASASIPLADLAADPVRVDADGIDAGLTVRRRGEATTTDATVTLRDANAPAGRHPYWVRVRQADGEMAWSSPVFVTVEGTDSTAVADDRRAE